MLVSSLVACIQCISTNRAAFVSSDPAARAVHALAPQDLACGSCLLLLVSGLLACEAPHLQPAHKAWAIKLFFLLRTNQSIGRGLAIEPFGYSVIVQQARADNSKAHTIANSHSLSTLGHYCIGTMHRHLTA